jgi:hypothetical protein
MSQVYEGVTHRGIVHHQNKYVSSTLHHYPCHFSEGFVAKVGCEYIPKTRTLCQYISSASAVTSANARLRLHPVTTRTQKLSTVSSEPTSM